jgi:hypothetical protein
MKIYLIKENDTNYYKIGVTKQPIYNRIKQLQTGNAHQITLVDFYETAYKKVEKFLHGKFKKYKVGGEWFDLPLEEVIRFKRSCRECEESYLFLKENNHFIN